MCENKHKSKSAASPSLCWKCIHAVPSRDGSRGCSWMINLKPVEGWDAVESAKTYKVYGIYDKTVGHFVINKRTGAPLQYSSRQIAQRAIVKMSLHTDDELYPRILKTDRKISYRVITCPQFVNG